MVLATARGDILGPTLAMATLYASWTFEVSVSQRTPYFPSAHMQLATCMLSIDTRVRGRASRNEPVGTVVVYRRDPCRASPTSASDMSSLVIECCNKSRRSSRISVKTGILSCKINVSSHSHYEKHDVFV